LVERARTEVTDAAERERIVELVLTILVYKFPTLEREAIRQMLGLDELKQTRFYQEVKEEGVEEVLARAVPSFLRLGLSAEQIAEELGVEVETIARIIRSSTD
jgi:predicted transposase YdaD